MGVQACCWGWGGTWGILGTVWTVGVFLGPGESCQCLCEDCQCFLLLGGQGRLEAKEAALLSVFGRPLPGELVTRLSLTSLLKLPFGREVLTSRSLTLKGLCQRI